MRFGVLNSMHPDVRKIAPQNLLNNQMPSPTKQCDQMRILLEEKKILEDQIEELKKDPKVKGTIIQEMIRERLRRVATIKESLARKDPEPNTEFTDVRDVMLNARVICSTLSSSINLKQYVDADHNTTVVVIHSRSI